jgi:hypothetical protein
MNDLHEVDNFEEDEEDEEGEGSNGGYGAGGGGAGRARRRRRAGRQHKTEEGGGARVIATSCSADRTVVLVEERVFVETGTFLEQIKAQMAKEEGGGGGGEGENMYDADRLGLGGVRVMPGMVEATTTAGDKGREGGVEGRDMGDSSQRDRTRDRTKDTKDRGRSFEKSFGAVEHTSVAEWYTLLDENRPKVRRMCVGVCVCVWYRSNGGAVSH